MRPRMRSLAAGAALWLAPAPAVAAQCQMVFSVSVYNDAAFSEDRTVVYGFSTSSDNSILCTCGHGQYLTRTTVYAPDGAETTASPAGFACCAAVATNGRMGTYTVTGRVNLFCSCAGPVAAGGVAATIAAAQGGGARKSGVSNVAGDRIGEGREDT